MRRGPHRQTRPWGPSARRTTVPEQDDEWGAGSWGGAAKGRPGAGSVNGAGRRAQGWLRAPRAGDAPEHMVWALEPEGELGQ